MTLVNLPLLRACAVFILLILLLNFTFRYPSYFSSITTYKPEGLLCTIFIMVLRFKDGQKAGAGVEKKKKKKDKKERSGRDRSRSRSRSRSGSRPRSPGGGAGTGGGTGSSAAASAAPKEERLKGEGRIICSAETISGFGSCAFHEQVSPGNFIEILHPGSLQIERRRVEQVLSNRSLLLSDPFSRNFTTTTEFVVVKPPAAAPGVGGSKRPAPAEGEGEPKAKENEGEDDDVRFVQVREKVRGAAGESSYRTTTREVRGGATAALHERMKQGRDKFCW